MIHYVRWLNDKLTLVIRIETPRQGLWKTLLSRGGRPPNRCIGWFHRFP